MSFKRIISLILSSLLVLCLVPALIPSADGIELTVMFTHDIHDYLYTGTSVIEGKAVEHGGAAKLSTVIKENAGPNTVYLDCGDFSMGTLFETLYASDAVELRNLGIIGCDVATFGNHEFDFGAKTVAEMLRNAKKSGDPLPALVQSNIDFSGTLSDDQKDLKSAFDELNIKEYTIVNVGGYKFGIFGVMRPETVDCISCSDYIAAAKNTVSKLKSEKCDIIIALSNSESVDDTDTKLAQDVSDIDIIISGNPHLTYGKPVYVGDTLIAAAGESLTNVGKISFTIEDGKMNVNNYELIGLNSSVRNDAETAERINGYKTMVNEKYLSEYGAFFDEIISYSKYNFVGLDEMYTTHKEFNIGNFITDAYLYETNKLGMNDYDVAIVPLGSIKSTIARGSISTADAFEICSYGTSTDGTPGQSLATCYITGKELKLITELDASCGQDEPGFKLSYNGVKMVFNTKKISLDKITDVSITRNKRTEEIEDDKLYKILTNSYFINKLSLVPDLTYGFYSVVPKTATGDPIADLNTTPVRDQNGKEIKEWIAIRDYLKSFPDDKTGGFPNIPDDYARSMGRKKSVSDSSEIFSNPGVAIKLVPIAAAIIIGGLIILIVIVIILIVVIRKIKKKKMADYIDEAIEKKKKQKEKEEKKKRIHRELYKPKDADSEAESPEQDTTEESVNDTPEQETGEQPEQPEQSEEGQSQPVQE